MSAPPVEALPVCHIVGCDLCDVVLAIVGTTNDCRRALDDPRIRPAPPPDAIAHVVGKLHARGHAHDGPNEICALSIFVFDALQLAEIPKTIRAAFGNESDPEC